MIRLCALLVLLGLSAVHAQTLTLGAALSTAGSVSALARFENLRFGDDRVSLEVSGGLRQPFGVALQGRSTQSFGPAGNVIFRGLARLGAARFESAIGVQGVLGPVAATATATAFVSGPRDPEPFAPARDRFRWLEPERSGAGLGLELMGSYRLSRTLILTAEPDLYWLAPGGPALRLGAELRFVRLIGADDLRLLLAAHYASAQGYGALGAAYDLNRDGWPDLRAALYVGAGSRGLWPGGSLTAGFAAGESSYRLELAAEPYRTDQGPFRGAATLETPAGAGVLGGALEGRVGATGAALRASARYRLPL